jgi:hypothetical protein
MNYEASMKPLIAVLSILSLLVSCKKNSLNHKKPYRGDSLLRTTNDFLIWLKALHKTKFYLKNNTRILIEPLKLRNVQNYFMQKVYGVNYFIKKNRLENFREKNIKPIPLKIMIIK